MASETFEYPDATTPTMTLTFATSGHSMNDIDGIVFNQITGLTLGGVRMTTSLGDNFNQWGYTFIVPISSETETDWADVKSFFGSSYANGAQNSFVWTESDGTTTHTVYMTNMELQSGIIAGTYKQCTIMLEEVNT